MRYEGADHGFVHDPSRPAHRADDAADAWSRVLAFLPSDLTERGSAKPAHAAGVAQRQLELFAVGDAVAALGLFDPAELHERARSPC